MSKRERNCRIAIDVLIHGMSFDEVQRRYGVSLATLRSVLIFLAHPALGLSLDSLSAIRHGIRQRLRTECLLMVGNQENAR